MQKLIRGLREFQNSEYRRKQSLFEELDRGQSPGAMFITCSDSRVDPNLITGSDPGDLFVLRNAGNMIPRHDPASGEVATIEYAVKALKVEDIVVCGHSQCGAMNATLSAGSVDELPSVAGWLRNAKDVVERTRQRHGDQSPERMLELVIQENVRMQLENLMTLRCVAEAMGNGELRLHGWTYDIRTGVVQTFDHEQGDFVRLDPEEVFQVDDSTTGFA